PEQPAAGLPDSWPATDAALAAQVREPQPESSPPDATWPADGAVQASGTWTKATPAAGPRDSGTGQPIGAQPVEARAHEASQAEGQRRGRVASDPAGTGGGASAVPEDDGQPDRGRRPEVARAGDAGANADAAASGPAGAARRPSRDGQAASHPPGEAD